MRSGEPRFSIMVEPLPEAAEKELVVVDGAEIRRALNAGGTLCFWDCEV